MTTGLLMRTWQALRVPFFLGVFTVAGFPVLGAGDFQGDLKRAKDNWGHGRFLDAAKTFEQLEIEGRSDAEKLEALAWKLSSLNIQGQFRKALSLASGLSKSPIAPDSQRWVAQIALQHAEAEKGMGDFSSAEERYGFVTQASFGGDADTLAEAFRGLAEISIWKGDFPKAEEWLQKAIGSTSKLGVIETARVDITRGDLNRFRGRLKESEEYYMTAIGLLKSAPRFLDPELADADAGLVEVRILQGREKDVQSLLAEAFHFSDLLELGEANLRREDVQARIELWLGGEDALGRVSRALKQREDEGHFGRALSRDSLGLAKLWGGNFNRAIEDLQESTAQLQTGLGNDSPLLATALLHLSQAYRLAGLGAKADAAIREVRRIEQKYLSNDSPAAAELSYEEAYRAFERQENGVAETLLRQVVGVRTRSLPRDHAKRLDADASLGIVLALAKPNEAEPLLRAWLQANPIRSLSPLGPHANKVKSAYAETLYGLERYADAIPFYEAVQSNEIPLESREHLGDSYLRVRKPEKAVRVLAAALSSARDNADAAARSGRIELLLIRAYLSSDDLENAHKQTTSWLEKHGNKLAGSPALPLVDSLAEALLKKKQFARAESYFLRLMDTAKSFAGTSTLERLTLKLGDACEGQGKMAEASAYFHQFGESALEHDANGAKLSVLRALELRERSLGKLATELIPVLLTLARIQGRDGDNGRAEAVRGLGRAQQILDRSPGEDIESYAGILNERGVIAQTQGKAEEARSLYEEAGVRIDKLPGRARKLRANIFFNRGQLAFEDNRHADAERYFTESLSISEGSAQIDQLEAIASFYETKERYADAQGLFRKASGLRSAKYGEESPQAAEGYYNLAGSYMHDRNGESLQQALGYARRALDIRERDPLGVRIEASATRSLLADIYEASRNFSEAAKERKQLLSEAERADGQTNARDLHLIKLGDDYRELKDYASELGIRRRTADLRKTERGFAEPSYRIVQPALIVALERNGLHGEAEANFQDLRNYLKGKTELFEEEHRLLVAYSSALESTQAKEAKKLRAETKRLEQLHPTLGPAKQHPN